MQKSGEINKTKKCFKRLHCIILKNICTQTNAIWKANNSKSFAKIRSGRILFLFLVKI